MRTEHARHPKELEQQNARLEKLMADLSLHKAILYETLRGNLLAAAGAARRFKALHYESPSLLSFLPRG